MSKKIEKIIELDRQIEEQEDYLVSAPSMNGTMVHSGLLSILTERWCKLVDSLSEAEMVVYYQAKELA